MHLFLSVLAALWVGQAVAAKPHEKTKPHLYVAPPVQAKAPLKTAAAVPKPKPKPAPLSPIGVLGISTVTLRSPNAEALSKWYREKISLEPLFEEAGAHEFAVQEGSAFLVAPLANEAATAPPQTRMVRFEVANLRKAIEKLNARGIKAFVAKPGAPSITEEPTMTYAFVQDPAGNWIQLAQRR